MAKAVTLDQMTDMCEAALTSREARNGFTEAIDLITVRLPAAFAKDGGPTLNDARKTILDELYDPMLADRDFSESTFDGATKEAFRHGHCIDMTEKVVAYCVFAVTSYFQGNESLSWSYAADAKYWSGILLMAVKRNEVKLPLPGQQLASLKHVKTKAERKKIEAYWREHIDHELSAQRAATAIESTGITELSHKKIAEIVSLLRKAEPMRMT